LYWAFINGHLEIVKELLIAGANPNIVDEYGVSPLYLASINDNLEVIELLKTYFSFLHDLSLRSVRKFRIDFSSIPKNLLE